MRKILLATLIITLIACDWPFNTDTTDDVVFKLNLTHDIERIMPSAQVILSWSEITIENFSCYKIERITNTDTAWTLIAELTDAFVTSYIDTITDDEDLFYRVGILDIDENAIWANSSIDIPRTTSTTVPDEFETIQPAFDNGLIDDGDTIFVKSGIYTETLGIAGKDVLIESIDGYKATTLQASDGERVLFIGSGEVNGFTVKNGSPGFGKNGGGIAISQSGTIKNCYITENISGGYGGGISVTGNGNIYNCILTKDTATTAAGIYISNASGKIINNTIVNNDYGYDVSIDGDCEGLVFRNNIIINSKSDIDINFVDQEDTTGVIIDYLLLDNEVDFGNNIIIAEPLFLDNIEFNLAPNSPAIDAGHPDEQYNDRDGTRNDIGAYGGPRNNK